MSHAKDLDWDQLGFNYVKTDYRYVSYYRDGAWDEGGLSTESKFLIDESAHCMHYGQACFEGMKAYRRKDGGLQLFRPEQNAQRFQESCRRLLLLRQLNNRIQSSLYFVKEGWSKYAFT